MPEHSAKELILKPITDALAGAFIREYHYSGKGKPRARSIENDTTAIQQEMA